MTRPWMPIWAWIALFIVCPPGWLVLVVLRYFRKIAASIAIAYCITLVVAVGALFIQ